MQSNPNRPSPQTGLLATDTALDRVTAALTDRYRGVFSTQTVGAVVEDSYARLAETARVHAHLPNLTARFASDRLAAIARTEGVPVSAIPEVLFVCVHNAGRSQMAAALLDRAAAGSVHVRSAGSAPGDQINPAVERAMDEIGVDLSLAFPKPLTDEVVEASDVVITMGCGDACPLYPGKRYLDWQLTDPAGQPLEVVRGIRDEIDARVRELLAELLPADAATEVGG